MSPALNAVIERLASDMNRYVDRARRAAQLAVLAAQERSEPGYVYRARGNADDQVLALNEIDPPLRWYP
jgi:hypothetical protein